MASQIVLEHFKSESPQGSQQSVLQLRDDDIAQTYKEEGAGGLRIMLLSAIRIAYGSVSYKDAKKVAEKVASRLKIELDKKNGTPSEKTVDIELHQRLEIAFTEPDYIGDGGNKFIEYLQRSWHAYQDDPDAYKAPYTAIVQSSGFGKSQLLLELAQETTKHNEMNMRVLYMCTRGERSTGFPVATRRLSNWLFASRQNGNDITRHLVVAYCCAQKKWSSTGEEWLELLTSGDADIAAEELVGDAETELRRLASKISQMTSKQTSIRTPMDEAIDQYIKLTPCHAAEGVVILAVDETRALLGLFDNGVDYFRLLRRALVSANEFIRTKFPKSGIFAVLVDTNSKVSDLTPPLISDPSSRTDLVQTKALFPPFVLSHTMDAYWRYDSAALLAKDEVAAYKLVVTEASANESWKTLVSMGRPMWASMYNAPLAKLSDAVVGESGTADSATKRLLDLSARKLLLGCDPRLSKDFNEDTMFGVASVLCRLGVRPYTTSALASRVVADFMAVLAYVNHENDGLLSSYASDPVLALGAARAWYMVEDALEKYILPQLRKLLMNEVLDAGGVEEVVARIVLLLVMDSSVVIEAKAQSARDFLFTGQLWMCSCS